MGKVKTEIYCYLILTKVTEMFVERLSTKRIILVQTLKAIEKLNRQKILINQLVRSYKGDNAETLQNCS